MNYNPNLDPISQKDFTDIMNTMSEVFPAINGKARIKYYWDAVRNFPLVAMKDVSKHFLMSSKQMPLPQDFIEAMSAWKKKNNFYQADIEIEKIECTRCNDLGIVRIQHHNPSDFDCLMNCDCNQLVGKKLKAPSWSNDLLQAFRVGPCPVDWFKPKQTTTFNLGDFEVMNIISFWNDKKLKAEKHWCDLGYDEALT